LGERISGRRQKSGSWAAALQKEKAPTEVGAQFSTALIVLGHYAVVKEKVSKAVD
jgi:hypothetical protein